MTYKISTVMNVMITDNSITLEDGRPATAHADIEFTYIQITGLLSTNGSVYVDGMNVTYTEDGDVIITFDIKPGEDPKIYRIDMTEYLNLRDKLSVVKAKLDAVYTLLGK